jgi:tRNA(Ile)-lysidine synthase
VIVQAVRQFLDAHAIRWPLLVAVSGGPDSTALFLALAEIGDPLIAGHVNHHLRGPESDDDESFIRELCGRAGVPLHIADGTLDPAAIRRHGIEAAAREIRHARLQEIRRATRATVIATAHQKNDQAETVLMRLLTGGGIAALRGIHPLRDDGVIRPLLEVTRADIEAFLRQRGVSARLDRSNRDPRFLRNRIRRVLSEFDPQAIENLAAIARQAREQWAVLERVLDDLDTSTWTEKETRFHSFPPDPWLRRALLHRHIRRLDPQCRDISAADLERIAGGLDSMKRVSITASLELLRRGGEWILRKKPAKGEWFEKTAGPNEVVDIPDGRRLVLSRVSGEGPPTRRGSFASLRTRTQRFQLPDRGPVFTVRNRRPGDRFQPLGMSQEKKLKDFLIDRKIPIESRDRIPLLVWRGKIVCVTGVEISEIFKVTDSGGDLYEVSIEEQEGQEGVQRETDRQAHR